MKCYYENRRVCFCKAGPCCYAGKEITCLGFKPEPTLVPYTLRQIVSDFLFVTGMVVIVLAVVLILAGLLRYLV